MDAPGSGEFPRHPANAGPDYSAFRFCSRMILP
jgi:hypothetical protein